MAATRARQSKVPFEIHEDRMDMDELVQEVDFNVEEDEQKNQEQIEEDDGYSDDSEESDGVVDSGVLEDMESLQRTFKGIKDRFRLINRIGEGEITYGSN
jgi:cell division control protein 7